jgi:cell division protease FtsH
MGGRTAEELALKHMTTGAGNDIERATNLARKMVTEWGMSESLGPLTFGKKEEQIFLGRDISSHKDYSESTAQQIDIEVKKFIFDAYNTSMDILKANVDMLEALAQRLLEKETVDGAEVDDIISAITTARNQAV